MNRFFTISFITLSLVIGATGAAPVAHAQLSGGGQNNYCDNSGTCSYATQAAADAANTAMTATNAAALSAANKTATINQGSSDAAFNPVMSKIAGLFAWLVGVAALVLDWTVYYTVVNMGAYINKLTAIGVTWRILRDIGNIMLIFGFLAIGISVILNTERIGYGKKMLPMLLVAAVFLNFSLFFSEAIIDTGNLFATQFYTQINGGVTPTANTLKGITTANQGISSKLMSQLGLAKIYDVKSNSATLAKDVPWYIGFLAIILFIVTAFVMFSLAFILIARFIVLVFLIILAPIGFAGLAVPQLARKAGQWWSALFEQTITAPVLLLLLYVALAVITDAQFLTGIGGGTAGDVLGFVDNNNLAAFASYVMSFSIAIGLMLAVTISAKSLSAFGASKATALASKLSGVSIAAAAPGWVGRYTAGLGANYAAKKLRSTAFGRSFVGRGIAGTLEKNVAGASFDIRNTSVGKSVAGVGLSLGKGQTGGYKADLEARVKSYETAAAGITGGAKEKEEKATALQAREARRVAEKTQTEAKTEYDSVAAKFEPQIEAQDAEVKRLEKENEQKIAAQQAEIDRLEKEEKNDQYFEASGGQVKLDAARAKLTSIETSPEIVAARQNLAKTEGSLKEAADNLDKASKNFSTKSEEEKAADKNVGTAKKTAQREYAERLEERWGKIPVFGTAAAAAAPRVKGDIGKSKTDKEIAALLKKIQEKTGEGEGGNKENKEDKTEKK